MKKDFNSGEDGGQQSRINAAGLINATLEKLWLNCYSAMAKGDYLKWNHNLDGIWAILGGDCKEGGKEEVSMNKLDLKLYETGNLSHSDSEGFERKLNPQRPLQYIYLKKKSLFLRRLQNSQGKGTAYASDDDDDWD